jgi:hypothetical protein
MTLACRRLPFIGMPGINRAMRGVTAAAPSSMRAAPQHVNSFQSQPFARSHCSTERCPPPAASPARHMHARGKMPGERRKLSLQIPRFCRVRTALSLGHSQI